MRRAFLVLLLLLSPTSLLASWKVIAWNDLGMHCTDGVDYSVFGILPPYNNIHAQVIDANGKLVRDASAIRVTYQAVADPAASINMTSAGKTNFWTYVNALFGASPAVDTGLAGKSMPGSGNLPQPMTFDTASGWFTAEGVPITPYDDSGVKNYYPMMRVIVRDSSGAQLAQTDIVLPVSDEMSCSSCHGNTVASASLAMKPSILQLHDTRNIGDPTYTAALARAGYKPEGLLATAQSGTPILCARCHASNALPGTGYSGIESLTRAIHSHHASVPDPENGQTLDASSNRSSCYRCHPGATTRCLRGAMGRAVLANGELEIQCQNCHGSMSVVGASARNGWLEEPTCQSCHTGTATSNSGSIRYVDAFTSPGVYRTAADATFATNGNVPAAGLSLFRFSKGHGGLYCEACHGSTHAEYPSTHVNDNVQPIAMQGHAGVIAECTACHATMPSTSNGGPHGMHTIGQQWVSQHADIAEHGSSACQACHGSDSKGTALSRTFGDRNLSAFGAKSFWRGYQVGCFTCHNGPGSDSTTRATTPSASPATAATRGTDAVNIALRGTDPGGSPVTLRVVSPPQHGTAGISGSTATYIAEPGFTGRDTFTYAASNGMVDSALATVTVDVGTAVPKRRAAKH